MMHLKYRCLILDHDDTHFDSTSVIHYPAHVEVMKQLRPEAEPVSLEDWFRKNFHPGIMEFLTSDLAFTDAEIEHEFAVWREYNLQKVPFFFPGFINLLQEFKERGGIVAVVSHSEVDIIENHYSAVNGEVGFTPDIIFGWSDDEAKRKPNPYPVNQILSTYGLDKADALIVDDLKPGVLMAKAAGVDVAAAGWAHKIPEIQTYMKANCQYYFSEVENFRSFILE